jgi:hypothetical protein
MNQVKRFFLTVTVAFAMVLALAPNVLGAANPGASCIGFGSSQAATSAPGARAEISHLVIDVEAPALGLTPGGVYSFFAKLHLAEACFPEE